MTLIVATSAVTVDRREKISSTYFKKHGKRGAFSVEYGYPSQEPAPIYETTNPPNFSGYEYSYPQPVAAYPEPVQPPVAVHPVG